ncbi:hypothetical protein [Paenirhodobacter enshiensis]|uniref:hypothetical protein n=1 Tax=Paenirhodobacter enshiensis TaxID=1105367 RepID=UPI001267BE72|nr:hypothetical protein [Paenirhodobacter enshiensis]
MTTQPNEEERRLREAREQLEAAKSVIAELEGQRLRRHISRRKPARPKATQSEVAGTQAQSVDVSDVGAKRQAFLRKLLRIRDKPRLPEPSEIKRIYEEMPSLDGVAKALRVDRRAAVKALATAGVDIREDIAKQWDAGSSLRELRQRHGPGCDTISRWIKSTGREVQPRNANRQCDEALIIETYLKTRSANRCAQAAGISWEKARNILRKQGMWGK